MPQFPQITLQATTLQCNRGGRTVFSGLDLEVSGGSLLMLKGPNGVGKSSLLLTLADLIESRGSIEWTSSAGQIEEIARLIHFSGHQHAIKPELSLSENLSFWADMFGGAHVQIDEVLSLAGLGGLGRFAARNLSAGQTHRLALCRLLIAPRPVWLLDEPSSALDAEGDKWVGTLLDTHLTQNGLAIVATHREIPLTHKSVTLREMGGDK